MTDLIELPYWIYLSLIQGVVLLALMFTIFFMKFKKSTLKIKTLETAIESQTKTDNTEQLKTRIDSLEQFQDRYFETKQQYATLLAIYEELEGKIKNEFDDENQAKLQDILDQLAEKKSELAAELKFIEQEFELLAQQEKGNATDTPPTSDDTDDIITTIQNIIAAQKSLITDLNNQLAKLSAESEQKSALQDSVTKLEVQSKELLDALDVLKDGNEFLQDQIQALLKQEAQSDTKTSHEIEVLKTHLADKNKEYDELYQKFTKIEAEYNKLEQEQPKSSEN